MRVRGNGTDLGAVRHRSDAATAARTPTLANVLLLTHSLDRAIAFYGDGGLGLDVLARDERMADLDAGQGVRLAIAASDQYGSSARDERAAGAATGRLTCAPWQLPTSLAVAHGREAALCTGYSPFLNFAVDDFDATMYRLLERGGRLDGPVKYPLQGRVAAVRSPDGHMVGLYERHPSS